MHFLAALAALQVRAVEGKQLHGGGPALHANASPRSPLCYSPARKPTPRLAPPRTLQREGDLLGPVQRDALAAMLEDHEAALAAASTAGTAAGTSSAALQPLLPIAHTAAMPAGATPCHARPSVCSRACAADGR